MTTCLTRDECRRSVEALHRGSGLSETAVARNALDLAARAARDPAADDCSHYVGAYLIGDRRADLSRLIGSRERLRYRLTRWVYRHHTLTYFAGILFFSAVLLSLLTLIALAGEMGEIQLLFGLLLSLPATQLSVELMNALVMRLLPPRTLPKMDYSSSGIPYACRTLVIVPILLVDTKTIQDEAERLELRYLANREENLLFGLLSDYADAGQLQCEGDEPLLLSAKASIETLNQRYGEDRFLLFHREREWSPSEQKFIGWERKRGKLEELNELINGTRSRAADSILRVGDPGRLHDVRYVITLDSDTQLPNGTARRLIETLSHPENQAKLDSEGKVRSGYTIIQPRVSPSLPSMNGSPFSRLFSDPIGVDPYTAAVSDVYQDLAGEGSYHGKGIYDVRTFNRVLAGRFPEEWLLSHDLIEGAHVRVGLASDIELYDEFPQDYLSFVRRQHRWIRGDWQIAGWLLPGVPQADGKKGPNFLSWFNRWKIFDNLRRSLLPIFSVAVLTTSWLFSPWIGWIATGVVALQILFHSLGAAFAWTIPPRGSRRVSIPRMARNLSRVLVEAALLPYQAWLALDAIARALYRRNVSHRGLLEWTSARAMHRDAQAGVSTLLLFMCLASVFSIIVGWGVLSRSPSAFGGSAPWLVLWCLSPGIGWFLNLRPKPELPESLLRDGDRQYLRTVACRTWRYFSEFVTERTGWLPPDNYQISYQNQLAMRTSPTNIGLWMVSVLGAHEFGYLTVDEITLRLTGTMATIGRLERHEGHLFNWYDIDTLSPLKPRYVSTVDSGNLLAALWTLDRGLESLSNGELLDGKSSAGLHDAGESLRQAMVTEKKQGVKAQSLLDVLGSWESPPHRIVEMIGLLRRQESGVRSLTALADESPSGGGGVAYWTSELQARHAAWLNISDRYLAWIEILGERTAEEIFALNPDALPPVQRALRNAPSLRELGRGDLPWIPFLLRIREQEPSGATAIAAWIDRLFAALEKSKWLAGEMLASLESLAQSGRELSGSMNMRFLYDAPHRLFSIGYNLTEGRLDRTYYDLLASEARLGSFVAIARGDIPAEHWFALSRPYGVIEGRQVLLSWTGTMFEYLMPLLFQRSYANSLLHNAVAEAVATQIAHGRTQHLPWGMSESASGDLDLNKTYQYHAFGVPALGLKRHLEEKTVVAPYATLLALNIAPREGLRNLGHLAAAGLFADYGFYEAMDFSLQATRERRRGVVVQAYMGHHQAMSFLALANLLCGNSIQNHFHSDPRVRTFEPLLHERIPHLLPRTHLSTRHRSSSIAPAGEVAPLASQFETPHTSTPKTQLLCNGRYGLMLTNAGGGYSRWGDVEITRWRSDRTRDSWGTFCYIHDPDSDRLWCNTFHPTGGDVEGYSADFSMDRAVFRRVDDGLECETEIIVAPEDDVEIRRMTLINRSLRVSRLDLTSYIELSLAPHNVDRQHPSFNKLFIQTEPVPEQQTLLAFRRLRQDGEPSIVVGHRFVREHENDEGLRFETDRARFIGRGHTLASPMGAIQEPGNSQGFAIDPILSLRRSLTLGPGERVRLSMILACAATREEVLGMMHKYGDPHAIDRAMDFAWNSAALALRVLRIQPDDARRFQQIAGHLLFPNPLLRAPEERITGNCKGQAGLWAYGISGDLPIALVVIGVAQDVNLVRQMLQAHRYWRIHGLTADLVILNEESPGYERPLQEELERLIRSNSEITGVDRPGGVFLRSTELMPAEDQTLLRTVASTVMVAARGNLSQQLSVSQALLESPGLVPAKRDPRDPSAALPFMELPYFNSIGGFTADGLEYAIYLGPGMNTPMPWVNVISNPEFGTLVSETGAGFTWYGNSQHNRLTEWSNDAVLDPPSEALYIRDDETGVFWSPCASPIREESAYRARHGAGYTVFEHNSHGIEQELTLFVPVDDAGGDPLKLQRLLLRNDSARPRKLSVTYYVEWTLGATRESSQMHVVTNWDDEAEAIFARNYYHPDYADRVAFASISLPADSFTGDRTGFLGRNRSMQNPVAMERIGLQRRTGAGLDPCAALQATLTLLPGERIEITCSLGQARSVEEARSLVRSSRNPTGVQSNLDETKAWWNNRLDTIHVHTPELAVDLLVNRWLLYQTLSCRIWGRSAFYQPGGAFGFRDQLQDATALLHAHPGVARAQILLAASHQFPEGDVQHWWHPPNGSGIRSRVSDDLLWLPYTVAEYVRVSGDVSILREPVSFLDAPMLDANQTESYQTPGVSAERESLFEHCRRAVARGLTSGPHGLPLIGTGDWNDGMNRVGPGGKGESVWLGWFLAEVLSRMAEMSELFGRPDLQGGYQENRRMLIERLENFAWDGEWYLRATFDDGTPLGSSANAEARIDSLPQSWAWLSDGAGSDRARRALESAWKQLVHEEEGVIAFFEPPFDTTTPSPGYIQGYPPGVRENGGQYTHAAVWLAMAMARSGNGTRAAGILRVLNPVERTRDTAAVWRYGVEPYVMAADVYRSPGRIGRGGWSWYTGSAAWMYRAWVEELLGLHVRRDTMWFTPVIPGWWSGFQMSYRHGEAFYEIQVQNPDHCERGVSWVELDGRQMNDGVIPLTRNLIKHRVVVRMGLPPAA